MAFVAMLKHRAVTAMAFPTRKVKIEVASMLMMVYRGLKCVIGQKQVANLVGHLVRKPWKGVFAFEPEVLHHRDQMGLPTLMTVEKQTVALQYDIAW